MLRKTAFCWALAGALLLVTLAAFPVTAGQTASAPAQPKAAPQTYGEGVDLPEATPIGAILADPDRYLGKAVRIEGKVLDVCPMKGCWMELGRDGEKIQVKVQDDVIVFPLDAKGQIAVAQGTVEAVEMNREDYLGYLAHLAEEKGETFDPEQLDLGDGPYRMIRIRGTGAEIHQTDSGEPEAQNGP